MNHSDSERIAGFLEENSYVPVSDIETASLVIFNTCGVRQMAEDRVYGYIHNIKKQETRNKKQTKIILTGCLSNRPDVQKRLKNKVDLFFPINNFETFENFVIKNSFKIKNLKLKISAQKNISNKESITYLSNGPKYTNNFQAFVPIMTGCNNFCAYCVVPYARGREVSRPAEEIISEVKDLVQKGYKQITLLGQNVNSYNDGKINFSRLLKKVDAIPGKFWIQFVSNHPKDVTPEMIETVAQCKKVCENFHLPIQAGDDNIIRRMNRKYTAREYMRIISKIRSAFRKYKPGVLYSITSDIIVGFPGETRKQFLKSAEIMEKAKYDMVFFGQYSPRPGTAAWNMKDNVSKAEKERREKFLNEILKKTAYTNNKKYLNTIQEILIEKEKGEFYFGKTRTQKNIKIPATNKDLIGKFVKAKITKANAWNLEGEIK